MLHLTLESAVPHICPILADVGFHGCLPTTLYQQQILKSMTIDTLHSQGLRFVEYHICQNRADMGTRPLSPAGL